MIGEVNWLAIAKAHTTGMMFFEHGTVAGNIVRINCPKTQIGRTKIGQSQKILTDTLPLILQPGAAGNNELTIVCK
ncbi:hypothetical protein [Rhizobium alvei]|uniref:Uncharacterized protein n=1 Tax=Rhizobium alvei TaxID=1132659 RepID=A0ABT8YTH3_9HYPH|nr:hypothetical protein [Rhizobium alvei]MDO6967023.1 hypothetical protein [Rhizobium alvei]